MEPSIELLWCNSAVMDTGLQMQEHSHICYQFYYILHGAPVFLVGGVELRARENSFFCIPPNTPHRMLPLESGKMHAYELKFFIHDEHIRTHLPAVPVILSADQLTEKMLQYVVRNWKNKELQNKITLDRILCSLLSCFFLDDLQYTNSGSSHIDTSRYTPIAKAVIAYIESNFHSHFTMEKMASALNYNKNYLSSAFSKATSIAIIDYLNLIRIRQAVIFFAYYNQDVFTAYESIGFTNPSHFSRVFKAMVGISPRAFKYAFSNADPQLLSAVFTEEPILNYCLCTLEEAFASLKRIGAAAKQLTQKN